MEFPDLGNNCTQCNELDFLPFVCVFCSRIFCKEHLQPHDHKCPSYDDNIISIPSVEKTEKVRCKFCRTDIVQSLERIICPKCNLIHCLLHRLPETHECPKLKEEALQERAKVKKTFQASSSNEPKIKGAKNDALARKVAIMKLKQKAQGPSIPQEERVYLFISVDQKLEPLYFSKTWSIGKCVDHACTMLKVGNDSNKLGAKRWIFRLPSTNEAIEFSKTLSQLVNCESVLDGDTLKLDLVE